MHAKLERLLSKSLTTLEVMAYYRVVHTGPGNASNFKSFTVRSNILVATMQYAWRYRLSAKTGCPGVSIPLSVVGPSPVKEVHRPPFSFKSLSPGSPCAPISFCVIPPSIVLCRHCSSVVEIVTSNRLTG